MSQVIYGERAVENNYDLGVDTDFRNRVAFGLGDSDGRLTTWLTTQEVVELIGQLTLWLQLQRKESLL